MQAIPTALEEGFYEGDEIDSILALCGGNTTRAANASPNKFQLETGFGLIGTGFLFPI